jgi:fumarate reductase subunit C
MDVPLALNATETAPAPVLAAPIINLAVKNGFGFTLIGASLCTGKLSFMPLTENVLCVVIFLSLVLLGTVLTQAYTYYTSYPR